MATINEFPKGEFEKKMREHGVKVREEKPISKDSTKRMQEFIDKLNGDKNGR